jgi:ribosome-binding protein aMBF1 (putative translation factor)
VSRRIRSPAVTLAIQKAIKQSGLSNREIGRRLSPDGDARSQVQKWLRGETGITFTNAERLEAALGISGPIVTVVRAELAREEAVKIERQMEGLREKLRRTRSGDG